MTEVPRNILIVDDNALVQEILRSYLEHEGYRVRSASSGEEALQTLRDEAVDLILLDIRMPKMSGLEVLTAVRSMLGFEDLPVIMATANSQHEDMIRAFELGANDYVVKPFDFPVVLARIQRRLLRRRSHQGVALQQASGGLGPGSEIEGRFRLHESIGKGRFGEVFKAEHLQLKRWVAIKVLKTGVEDSEDALARFLREGRSACRLDHPNAVSVLDFSVTPEGMPFLVMELLEGANLEEELQRHRRFAVSRAVDILLPVCAVLAEAHASGVIHRDIKPPNIFLHRGRQGEVVKVLDFGIAILVQDPMFSQRLTLDGIGPGTPSYMAPERFDNSPYDGRADVYSLGAVFFELLTGRPPFFDLDNKNPIKLALRHLHEEPQSPRVWVSDLPLSVEELIFLTLAKDPEKRPLATEVLARLRQIQATEKQASPGL